MRAINVNELKDRLQRDDITVVDVRDEADYEAGHIPGAEGVPVDSLQERLQQVADKERDVAVYSHGPTCPLCDEAASKLESMGFANVHRFADGLKGWSDAGFDLAKRQV